MFAWGAQWFAADAPRPVTARVRRGSVENHVTAVGALQAKESVDVGTQVSGQLRWLKVDVGDRVEKGELIAEIDPTVYEAAVRTDRANLNNLQAQLAQRRAELRLARIQLERNRRLVAERAVSQNDVDTLEASVSVAQAQVGAVTAQIHAARAELEGAEANLGYTKIYAPITGTVVSREVVQGGTVNAVQSAPTLITVSNLDVMTVWAQVAEADIHRVKANMPAYFTTLGMPDRRFEGQVRQVQPTPETDNDVVLYNVLIDVANPDGLLLPEMTVQVFFVLGAVQDVPVVALPALSADPKGGPDAYRAQVLLPDGTLEQRAVKLGLRSRQEAQVLDGLALGDQVVVGGLAERPTGGGRPPRMPPGVGGPRP